MNKPKIRIFCDICQRPSKFFIEPLKHDDLNTCAFGDIVCFKCKSIIATFSCDEECEIHLDVWRLS